jgi:predicted phosphoribosyltransferase
VTQAPEFRVRKVEVPKKVEVHAVVEDQQRERTYAVLPSHKLKQQRIRRAKANASKKKARIFMV